MSPSAATAPVVQFDFSRWLPSVLSDLRSLETSGQNIPGLGDLRVSSTTADQVRLLLTAISTAALPEPTLSPFSGGGVALICSSGSKELTLTAYPDQRNFVYMLKDENDEFVQDGTLTLDHSDQLRNLITNFLTNFVR
jgi:hypothetical protein